MVNKTVALLALGMLPALVQSLERIGDLDCGERVENRVLPVLTGHVDGILPCDFVFRFNLDERGETDHTTVRVSEPRCKAIEDEVVEAFAQYTFAPGKALENCSISIELRVFQ